MRRIWLLVALAACGSSASGTTALYVAAGTGSDFYALPFPNDLRRHDDGTLDLSAFPTNSVLAGNYRDAAETLDGFALSGQMSSRFSDALDPSTLPDPATSVTADASVYLLDLASGERTPIIADFRTDGTNTIK